jgi:hypothetical protein
VADRIYKGKLAAERSPAFPESAESFDTAHAGGLVAFELIKEILQDAVHAEDSDIPLFSEVNGSLWLHREDVWVKIDPDGTIEVGISGV